MELKPCRHASEGFCAKAPDDSGLYICETSDGCTHYEADEEAPEPKRYTRAQVVDAIHFAQAPGHPLTDEDVNAILNALDGRVFAHSANGTSRTDWR